MMVRTAHGELLDRIDFWMNWNEEHCFIAQGPSQKYLKFQLPRTAAEISNIFG
jgi:hypothetical protein